MPRSKYISVYLATVPGWAPSQEKKRRIGRLEEAACVWCVFWDVRGVCGIVSDSKGEEEEERSVAAEGAECGKDEPRELERSLAGHTVWSAASENGV